jgi:uncharacterized protein
MNYPTDDGEFNVILMIITRSCMLSCSYCYVKKEGVHMKPDVLNRSLQLISKIKKEKKKTTIIFFGGEPLIRFDLVKRAILTLAKADGRNLDKYDFCLFTNGILLNKIDLDFLKKFKVRLMISLDGDRQTHNLSRGKEGLDSYGSIIRAMPRVRSLGINTTCFATFTPESVKKLYKNFLHFKKIGFDLLEIYPALYRSGAGKWDKKALGVLKKQAEKISDDYLKDFVKNKKRMELCQFLLYKKRLKTGMDPIELDQKEICIDVDGEMYVGNEFLALNGKERKKIRLNNVLKINNLEEFFRKYIDNKRKFRAKLLKNPIIVDYYRDPALKAMEVFNKEMARLDKKLLKNG